MKFKEEYLFHLYKAIESNIETLITESLSNNFYIDFVEMSNIKIDSEYDNVEKWFEAMAIKRDTPKFNNDNVCLDQYLRHGKTLADNIVQYGMFNPFYGYVLEGEDFITISEGRHRAAVLQEYYPGRKYLCLILKDARYVTEMRGKIKYQYFAFDHFNRDKQIEFYDSDMDFYNLGEVREKVFKDPNYEVLERYDIYYYKAKSQNMYDLYKATSFLGAVFSRLLYGNEDKLKPLDIINNEEYFRKVCDKYGWKTDTEYIQKIGI